MIRIAVYTGLLAGLGLQAVFAADLTFTAENRDFAQPLSVYEASAGAVAAPVASGYPNETITLPDGTYRFGLGAYPWRSREFDVRENRRNDIGLSLLAIDAPAGSAGEFAVFSDDGILVSPLSVGQALSLPPGRYILRRDLADTLHQVDIGSEPSVLDMGAIRFSGDPEAFPMAVADAASRQIAAVASGDTPLAMMAGAFLVSTAQALAPARVEVVSGEISDLSLKRLHWSDAMPGGEPVQIIGATGDTTLTGRSGSVVLIGESDVSVAIGDQAPQPLPLPDDDTLALFWRLPDGTIANFDGLPVELAGSDAPLVPRDATVRLRTMTAGGADIDLSIVQGDQIDYLGRFRVGHATEFDVDIPAELDPDSPVRFLIAVSGAYGLNGQSPEYGVHVRLATSVDDLKVTDTTPTSVALSWLLPEKATGVAVYRGDATVPITGPDVLRADQLRDIGLSADRTYSYRVCPMDLLGLQGPCSEIEASTERP